jgi:hypothetical protein
MSPNQIVAWNLQAARQEAGFTQVETVKRLEGYGIKLSRAAYSAAESSWRGKRVRHFSADEVYAFARVFDQSFGYFFEPPLGVEDIALEGHGPDLYRLAVLDMCYSPGRGLHHRLELSPETSQLIANWAEAYSHLQSDREHEIDSLLKAHGRIKGTGFERKTS